MKDLIFTPRIGFETSKRREIELTEESIKVASVRGRNSEGYVGIVTETNGTQWRWYSVDCGLDNCICDAVIRPLTEKIKQLKYV